MIDDRDPLLTQLFTEQSEPAHGSDFMTRFIDRLKRDQRNRRIRGAGVVIAGVIVAALLAPWIALAAAAAIGSVAAGAIAARPLLDFPMAWLVVCSIAASVLPVIFLGITRRW